MVYLLQKPLSLRPRLLPTELPLLADLASGHCLPAKAIDEVPAGRLIGDELRSIAADIRDLEPLGNGFQKLVA